MSDKVTIDLGNTASQIGQKAALEKIDRWSKIMREQDARMQKLVQSISIPSSFSALNTEIIRSAVADYQGESIIPEGFFEKTQDYQEKSLEILRSINENTANLYTMVELINKSNDNQEELLDILTQILAIAAAKSKEEADSLFKKIMQKLTNTTSNVETMVKIMGWATSILEMVKSLLP